MHLLLCKRISRFLKIACVLVRVAFFWEIHFPETLFGMTFAEHTLHTRLA